LIQKKQKIKANPNASGRFAAQRHVTSMLPNNPSIGQYHFSAAFQNLIHFKCYEDDSSLLCSIKIEKYHDRIQHNKNRVWVFIKLKTTFNNLG